MRLSVLPLTAACTLAFSVSAAARNLQVPSPQYPTIQSAVNSAAAGDTVIVSPNITKDTLYHESVVISTKGLTLKGQKGAVMDGTNVLGDGVDIMADNVTVSGLTVQNYVYQPSASNSVLGIGIAVFSSGRGRISDNTLKNNGYDLYLGDPSAQTPSPAQAPPTDVQNNVVTGNGSGDYGIFVNLNSASISNNTISGPGVGVQVNAAYCHVSNNTVSNDPANGIYLYGSDCAITNNFILNAGGGQAGLSSYSGNGIYADGDISDTIANNRIQGSSTNGIYLTSYEGTYACMSDMVSNNAVSGSGTDGILLDYANFCTISNNRVTSSGQDGIQITQNPTYTYSNMVSNDAASHSGQFDGEDDNMPGVNVWKNDRFGTASPAGLGR